MRFRVAIVLSISVFALTTACDMMHSTRFDVFSEPKSVKKAFFEITSREGLVCSVEERPLSAPLSSVVYNPETSKIYRCQQDSREVVIAHLAKSEDALIIELYAGAGPVEPASLRSLREAVSQGLSSEFGDRQLKQVKVKYIER